MPTMRPLAGFRVSGRVPVGGGYSVGSCARPGGECLQGPVHPRRLYAPGQICTTTVKSDSQRQYIDNTGGLGAGSLAGLAVRGSHRAAHVARVSSRLPRSAHVIVSPVVCAALPSLVSGTPFAPLSARLSLIAPSLQPSGQWKGSPCNTERPTPSQGAARKRHPPG
jgi:hypothetical protein